MSSSSAPAGPTHRDADDAAHTVVLGAGANTALALAEMGDEARSSVRAILDDDPDRRGQRIAGIPIRRPETYPLDAVRRVIITSQMHEPRLAARAAELFGPPVRIDRWFRPDGLPAKLNATLETIRRQWNEPHPDNALWYAADRLHATLGERLQTLPTWRYGPPRQIHEFAALRRCLRGRLDWGGTTLLNLGCGPYHPLGVSLLAVLAGAASATATDLDPILDSARAARALADLLGAVLLSPTAALGEDGAPRDELVRRAESALDLERLAAGELLASLRASRLVFHRESIYQTTLPADSFDAVVARDVFEHLPEVPAALAILHERLRPGGHLVLFIDFSDHRRYEDRRYRHWSHLIDLQTPTHLGTNRLRFGDYPPLFEAAGLQCLEYRRSSVEPLPAGVRETLAPMFRNRSEDDLAVTAAVAVLRRPAAF